MGKLTPFLLAALLAFPCFGKVLVASAVAWVDDEVVTTTDVEREAQNRLATAATENPGIQIEALLAKLRQDVFQYLIDKKVRAHVVLATLSESQIEGLDGFALEKQDELARLTGSRAALRAQLSERGMTLEEHRDHIIEDILFEEARRRALPPDKTPVSPAEMRNYYDNNPEEFIQPASATVRLLTIRLAGRSREEARTLIEAAQSRIRGGEAFEDVARELSEGPKAESGGLWERVEKGSLTTALDEAAFAAPIGTSSEVIQTDFGLHILLVEQRRSSEVIPFDQASHRIEELLRQERTTARLREWLRALQKVAYVETREQAGDPR